MKLIVVLLLCLPLAVSAKDPYPKNPALDVQHYVFKLKLADRHDTLKATAQISILLKADVSSFTLDLQSATGPRGMAVSELRVNNKKTPFRHTGDKLTIEGGGKNGEVLDVFVAYAGLPADGLIISKNKYGDKTFFGDNWPNRARHWLPVIDHPSDKATCEFVVEAPVYYEVVANGKLAEESLLTDQVKLTHWVETVPIPTKVMVMGAARFAVEHVTEVGNIPVQSWVFRQDRTRGFYDYAPAAGILDTLQNIIGPYPFEKLANVQSKTRYGGMENAGNIFYFENSVTGQRKIETLIAHEIAHQWFGNSASEKDWHHIWLSEGFATYFAQVYREKKYGADSLRAAMKRHIPEIFEYHAKKPASPVVDTTIADLTKLLSTNSYQRGAWVLHMLRKKVGDEAFFKGIRKYYSSYAYSNALTDDFRKVMEEESGQKLDAFFAQWLYQPKLPKLTINWTYDAARKKLVLEVASNLAVNEALPLEIALVDKNGLVRELLTMQVSGKLSKIEWDAAQKPTGIVADPNVWLLAKVVVSR